MVMRRRLIRMWQIIATPIVWLFVGYNWLLERAIGDTSDRQSSNSQR